MQDRSICYITTGFLQSISPFVLSETEERSLTDIFSALLSAQLMPPQGLFEIRELLLISELHEDVMDTPVDDLIPALNYIKRKILEGRPYKVEEMPKITAELKQFLSKSKEERQKALEEENQRYIQELRRIQKSKNEVTQAYEKEKEERKKLEKEVTLLHEKDKHREEDFNALAENLKDIEETTSKRFNELNKVVKNAKAKQRRDRAILGICFAALLWLFNSDIVNFLLLNLNISISDTWLLNGINIISLSMFIFPSYFWLRAELWTREKKATIYTVVLVIAFIGSRILNDDSWGIVASIVEVAGLVASIAFLFFKAESE